MKIRTDFVTNSSSVSFILTMCDEMIKDFLRTYSIEETNPKLYRIINLLRNDIKKEGTCVFLEGKELYSKRIKFKTDEMMKDEDYDKPVDEIDFVNMLDDELWAYILGEYIYEGKLGQIEGFGATKIVDSR